MALASPSRYSTQYSSGQSPPGSRLSVLHKQIGKRRQLEYLSCLYPDARLATCGHYVASRDGLVSVYRKKRKDGSVSASYVGLNRCGDCRVCPNCAAVSSSRDAEDLRAVHTAATLKGFRSVLVTYTFSHSLGASYGQVRESFRQALSDMRSGRAWDAFRKRYGVQGYYAGDEETYGGNGWHPHEHDLMTVSRFADVKALGADLYALYAAALAKQGLYASRERGVQVDPSAEGVELYLTKFGRDASWDAPAEAAGGRSKVGRKGRTVWQLLDDASMGDTEAERLFREYADYWLSHTHRRSKWMPGYFRRMLGYNRGEEPAAVRDAMALTREVERGVRVLSLVPDEWYAVRWHCAEAVLLWLATIWDELRLRRYVGALRAHMPVERLAAA